VLSNVMVVCVTCLQEQALAYAEAEIPQFVAAYVGIVPTIVLVLEDKTSFWRALIVTDALSVVDTVGVGNVNSGRDNPLLVRLDEVLLVSGSEMVEQRSTAVAVVRPTTVIVTLTCSC
jgi:hypothetical protein